MTNKEKKCPHNFIESNMVPVQCRDCGELLGYPEVSLPLEERSWEETLNSSRITGHISGRHLILISPKEDVNDDNEYDYLDEWIGRRIKEARLSEREKILNELLEKGHGGGNWRRIILQALGTSNPNDK